jgi:hypothetical protein
MAWRSTTIKELRWMICQRLNVCPTTLSIQVLPVQSGALLLSSLNTPLQRLLLHHNSYSLAYVICNPLYVLCTDIPLSAQDSDGTPLVNEFLRIDSLKIAPTSPMTALCILVEGLHTIA